MRESERARTRHRTRHRRPLAAMTDVYRALAPRCSPYLIYHTNRGNCHQFLFHSIGRRPHLKITEKEKEIERVTMHVCLSVCLYEETERLCEETERL